MILHDYIISRKKKVSNQESRIKNLEKEEQNKPNTSRRKDIIRSGNQRDRERANGGGKTQPNGNLVLFSRNEIGKSVSRSKKINRAKDKSPASGARAGVTAAKWPEASERRGEGTPGATSHPPARPPRRPRPRSRKLPSRSEGKQTTSMVLRPAKTHVREESASTPFRWRILPSASRAINANFPRRLLRSRKGCIATPRIGPVWLHAGTRQGKNR